MENDQRRYPIFVTLDSNFIPNKKQLPKKEEPPIFVALERGLNASLEANIQPTVIESQI